MKTTLHHTYTHTLHPPTPTPKKCLAQKPHISKREEHTVYNTVWSKCSNTSKKATQLFVTDSSYCFKYKATCFVNVPQRSVQYLHKTCRGSVLTKNTIFLLNSKKGTLILSS